MCAALPPIRDKIAIVHTRPDTLTEAVIAFGFHPIPCKILDIVALGTPIPEADHYILSSVHAVPYAPTGSCILAVGKETQHAAIEAGLECKLYHPDAATLALTDLPEGTVVHLGGKELAPNMKRFLTENGILSCAVYEARETDEFPQELEHALAEGRLRAVLMFSARAAQVFTDLALCATNKELWQAVEGLALSPRIADAMQELPYARVRAAGTPDRNAILEMLSDEHPK